MIKKFLSPPIFDNDEEQSHLASQLWRVVLIMSAVTVLYLRS